MCRSAYACVSVLELQQALTLNSRVTLLATRSLACFFFCVYISTKSVWHMIVQANPIDIHL